MPGVQPRLCGGLLLQKNTEGSMRTLTNDAALVADWLLSTEQGHYALTLVIAFLMPWGMFS